MLLELHFVEVPQAVSINFTTLDIAYFKIFALGLGEKLNNPEYVPPRST